MVHKLKIYQEIQAYTIPQMKS